MSTLRTMPGGRVKRTAVPRGPNGRGTCRWCGLEVPPRRFTFCSAFCVHEWKLRSQPAYLREQVFLRDRGVCGGCGVDSMLELRRLRRSRGARRLELMAHWGMKTKLRKSLWDADHIVPVVEGGGECDLLNVRTLCLRCHRAATAQLRERIRRAKVAAMLLAEGTAEREQLHASARSSLGQISCGKTGCDNTGRRHDRALVKENCGNAGPMEALGRVRTKLRRDKAA